ncbi:MAG: dihydropteroate synthase [Chloroflexi bacterium]|nr:dihydropteroate synthase [Chloroflexota bacterium]
MSTSEEVIVMFIIANNITTRDKKIKSLFRRAKEAGWSTVSEPAQTLKELIQQCVAAGADALEINTQQYYDQPEAIVFAIKVTQQVTRRRLCLSSNNSDALMAGLQACQHPPLVNYISVNEVRLREMLPLIARHGAGVVLLGSDPVAPSDARSMLQKTAILINSASEVGIPTDDILIDPGLIHITSDIGQRHLVEILDFLRALSEATESPVKSTCWLANSSAGAPRRLRPIIEKTLLPMLAGAGLTSVFLDVLRRENRRTVGLIKIFNNQLVYSDSDVEP